MIPPFERVADKVAIVGFCQPHRDWVNYDEPDQEVWGLNRGYVFQPRAARWFEMHGPAIHEWNQRRPGRHMLFLQTFPGPVYMHQARPEIIPTAVDYPLKSVADDLGVNVSWFGEHNEQITAGVDRPYLSSTVNQEIALAIHMGFKEIGLYGIDLNTSSEYAWQKPGVEYMLGIANGRGIKIRMPEMCPLLQGAIYGRGYLSPKGEHLSNEQWMERINALSTEKRRIEEQLNRAIGGGQEVQWVTEQMAPGIDHEILDRRRQDFEKAIGNLTAQLHHVIGKLEESLYWAHQTPAGQNPQEALGRLVVATAAENQMVTPHVNGNGNGNGHETAGALLEHYTRIYRGGLDVDDGPANDSVEAALMDVASGGPVLVEA